MESSTVLAFRIFVMLSCLIIVPMAAIFGSAFPDVVKSVLVDRIVAWSTGKPPEPSRAEPEPDGFRAVKPGTTATASNNQGPGAQAPPWNGPEADTASWQTGANSRSPSGVVPLGAAAAREGHNQSASFSAPSAAATAYPAAEGAVPAADESPYHRGLARQPGEEPSAQRIACPLDPPERFTEMERKLREHGATYYLLETWGNEGELYRFHCRMAVGGNPNYTRHFEATDRDALKAMSDVLERVEAWRAGRLQ